MKIDPRALVQSLFVLVFVLVALRRDASAQTSLPQTSEPLNASVSDFGTTFVFSPPPVCPACIETELGFQHLDDGNYIPAILTFALPKGHTDINALVNLLDSEAPQSRRATHFGNGFDFVVRQQVAAAGGLTLTVAPRGTVFIRNGEGGRAGLTVAPQYSCDNNLAILNLTWTAAVGVSAANPRSDYLTSFDYYRTLERRGTALFLGFQQEEAAGSDTAGIEEGLVIPFRNGQVELSTQQLNLNASPQAQFQARVIVNWGKVFARR